MSAALKLHTEKNPIAWKVIRNSGNNNFEELDYYPFGAPLPGRNFNSSESRYGMNGQEKVDEIAGAGNHYTAEYWEYDPRTARRWNLDPKPNPSVSQYATFMNNPITFSDPKGDTVWVFATTLPGSDAFDVATHTFIIVKTSDNQMHYYAFGPKDGASFFGGSPLAQKQYSQDKEVARGEDTEHLKAKIEIAPPSVWTPTEENPFASRQLSMEEFDQRVIDAAESFGNNPDIKYHVTTVDATTGNCHTSTTTILSKAGLGSQELEDVEWQIPGLNWGFEDVKPWTAEEQKAAVDTKKQKTEEFIKNLDIKR